jgi:hypothetical protein
MATGLMCLIFCVFLEVKINSLASQLFSSQESTGKRSESTYNTSNQEGKQH